ncbi:MAG: hypothetical protein MJZ98_01345 [Paludibacteraceae bacterium]|nr:hypothetical protein [Paludibacteraceae bacterium]
MDWMALVSTILSAVLLPSCGILFFRQEKTRKNIENEQLRSEEWRKLYEESKSDSKEKEIVIKEKDIEILRLKEDKNCLTQENIRLRFQKCVKFKCFDRMPPFLAEEVGDESASEEQ